MKVHLSKLDKVFSQYIRTKAKGKCEYCGQTGRLETAHFHGRRKRSTRWLENNVVAVCFSCHRMFHEHPNKHADFMRKRLGSVDYEKLNILAETVVKNIDEDKLIEYFTKKIKLLEE